MGPQVRIFKKVIEFLGCVACLLGKFFTDVEARRIFITRQKWSREWSLLHNIFWNNKGDAFAWITYGGYSIITLLFGISICIDSKSKSTYAEKIFLFIGALMFFAVGGLVLASIDQIPDDLIDNAIVLGCLSFCVAFIFLIDMSEKMGKRRSDATQTDTGSIDRHYAKSQSLTTLNSQVNLMDTDENNRKNRESMRSIGVRAANNPQEFGQVQNSSNPFIGNQQDNKAPQHFNEHTHQNYHVHYPPATFSEDFVETQTLPSPQMPVFSKVKQSPAVISHLETEPYKKILTRSNQSQDKHSYNRYHDQAKSNNDTTFYDDFNSYRKQTYYEGPRVDQGKLVIRDYSTQTQQKPLCHCQDRDCEENANHIAHSSITPGYVENLAKIWDSRMHKQGSTQSSQKDIKGLNTVV